MIKEDLLLIERGRILDIKDSLDRANSIVVKQLELVTKELWELREKKNKKRAQK